MSHSAVLFIRHSIKYIWVQGRPISSLLRNTIIISNVTFPVLFYKRFIPKNELVILELWVHLYCAKKVHLVKKKISSNKKNVKNRIYIIISIFSILSRLLQNNKKEYYFVIRLKQRHSIYAKKLKKSIQLLTIHESLSHKYSVYILKTCFRNSIHS